MDTNEVQVTPLTDIVLAWAEAVGIESPEFQQIEDLNVSVLTTSAPGENDQYSVHVAVDHAKHLIQAMVSTTLIVPEHRRVEVAELFTRINGTLDIGNLSVSRENGTVMCTATIPAEEAEIPIRLVDNLMRACIAELDTQQPALQQVAFGDVSGTEAARRHVEREDGITAPQTTGEERVAPAWEQLPGTQVVKAWADELRNALAAGTADEWALTGATVVIEHEDLEGAVMLAARAAADANLQFLRLPSDQVADGELSFRARFRLIAPVMVFADPGIWLRRVDEGADRESALSVTDAQGHLARRMREFDTSTPVIIVTAASDISRIAPIFLGRGLFDRQFSIPPATNEAIARVWLASLGMGICGESIEQNIDKLGALLRRDHEDREQRELLGLQLRRKARITGDRIEFAHIIDMVIRGATERDEPMAQAGSSAGADRRATAVHEAGHAVASIVDSAGQNIPDYVTSVSGRGFEGVAVESYRYAEAHSNEITLRDLRHKVRTLLAGRIAEEIVFGPEAAGSGASSDLEKATRLVLRAVSYFGFHADMEEDGGANLAVVIDQPDAGDLQRAYPLAQAFLAREYSATKEILIRHRSLLDAITDRLLVDPLLDQTDLQQLCGLHPR